MTSKRKKIISLNTVFRYFLLILFFFLFGSILRQNEKDKLAALENTPVIVVSPEVISPGDPVMVTITSSSTVKEVSINGKKYGTVIYDKKPRAFVAIPFEEKREKYKVVARFNNGSVYEKEFGIKMREKLEKPLGIPEKLGGNTQTAGKSLVNNLSTENSLINKIQSTTTPLWSESFVGPLKTLYITDEYGYSRNTVGYNILHKGTDFRAPVGTEVFAINRGRVVLARDFTVYGNTIIVDHGNGLISLYMHLSRINVKEGDSVKAGEVIGLSGKTGYAEAPHLHISIKLDGESIDPATFFEFFGVL